MSNSTTLKTSIINKINDHATLHEILKCYKGDIFSGSIVEYVIDDKKDGFAHTAYFITINDKLSSIIVPIYCTASTITWAYGNSGYMQKIKSEWPEQYASMTEDEIESLIVNPLFFYNELGDKEVIFLGLVKLTDWLNYGHKGKNGNSVYFWREKLPNNYCIPLKQFKNQVFVSTLPGMTDKELKTKCVNYATESHKKFADISQRSEQTKIKNIADGLYVQIKTYLWMLDSGYNVTMEWSDGDDLGIDIIYNVNGTNINIDVKSTKTDVLRISKNRKETDFYAVCKWEKSKPVFLGLLFKFHFWQSNVINTTSPEKKNEMYCKPLADISKSLVTMDKAFTVLQNYNTQKMKHNERLFMAE